MTDKPTLAELLAAYPGCPNVMKVEHDMIEYDGKWKEARNQCKNVDEVALNCKRATEMALVFFADGLPENLALLKAALPEMDHPDFRRYVAGRLGAI